MALRQRVSVGGEGLQISGKAYSELKLTGAAVVDVMVDGNAVIEANGGDGQVDAKPQAPVVTKAAKVDW